MNTDGRGFEMVRTVSGVSEDTPLPSLPYFQGEGDRHDRMLRGIERSQKR